MVEWEFQMLENCIPLTIGPPETNHVKRRFVAAAAAAEEEEEEEEKARREAGMAIASISRSRESVRWAL